MSNCYEKFFVGCVLRTMNADLLRAGTPAPPASGRYEAHRQIVGEVMRIKRKNSGKEWIAAVPEAPLKLGPLWVYGTDRGIAALEFGGDQNPLEPPPRRC